MKLIIDIGNTGGLKILIAANLQGTSIEVNQVNPSDKTSSPPRKLPELHLTTDNIIFSPNAAARFLLGDTDKNAAIFDQWSEWEATLLQPVLYRVLSGKVSQGKIDEKTLQQFKLLLKHADGALNGKQYFVGEKLTVIDVIIWSSLFLVYHPQSQLKGVGPEFSSLSAYYDRLNSEKAFQDATKTLFPKVDAQLKTFVQSHSALPLPNIKTKDLYKKSSSANQNATVEASESPCEPTVTPEERKIAIDGFENGKSTAPMPAVRQHPILPKSGAKNIMINSALPYVNNVPHLGNVIGCVLSADVYSRFCRLRNYNVLYVCGTDEYGTATETKAVQEGLTPQEICDKYNKLHTEIYKWFNIDFDYFGRTTTPEQTKIAQDIFFKLEKNGNILREAIDQLHCTSCDRFLADRFVEGICPLCGYEDARGDQCDRCGKLINAIELRKPRCKLCAKTPVVRTSNHLFLDLPTLTPRLVEYTEKQFETGLFTHNVKVTTRTWIRDGLKARCISRDLKWGVPVPLPGYESKVFYVWYDAPIGYISITANYTKDWEKWWKNPDQVELVQFMAKDNIPFHSVIFPCTLLGTNETWTMVNHMSATEYLNYEDTKFSKSRGIGVFGNDVQSTGIPADIYRFYLLYLRPEGQDSAFSWDDLVMKNNSELLNNLGNFINRALMFVKNNFNGEIPELKLEDEESELFALINRELKAYVENLDKIRLRDGIRCLLSISRLGNQYMQAQKPWVLVKGADAEKNKAGTVVGVAANIACLLSVLIKPYMPDVSKTIQEQLNAPDRCNVVTDSFISFLPKGHKIGNPKPLFNKIEANVVTDLKERFAGTQDTTTNQNKKGAEVATTISAPNPEEAARLTAEATKQGEKVRDLKAQKAEKSVIDEEVAKLLLLKKQLLIAEGKDPNQSASSSGKKKKNEPKAPKEQKKQETEVAAATSAPNPAEAARLTAEAAKQGEKVRDLKAQKAEKSVIDEEVAKLLMLKKQLLIAEGKDPNQSASSSGKKKKVPTATLR